MAGKSRSKGKVGEREIAHLIAELTGFPAKRRVRQHEGDSDIEGVPGWSVEVKRHAKATKSDIARWWDQAVAQSDGGVPVLMYRLDRADWRAVWPASVMLAVQHSDMWREFQWTCESSVEAWAAVARECMWTAS